MSGCCYPPWFPGGLQTHSLPGRAELTVRKGAQCAALLQVDDASSLQQGCTLLC